MPTDLDLSQALQKIGQPAIPALASGLADESQQVRDGAVEAMFELVWLSHQSITIPTTVIPSLLKILACGQECRETSASSAARILGEMGDDAKETVPALLEVLRHGTKNARSGAETALGEIYAKPELVVPALTDAALNDSDAETREDPAYSLRRLAQSGHLGSGGKAAMPGLISLLSDPVRNVKIDVSFVLGNMGPDAKDAVPTLLEGLRSTKDENVRGAFEGALAAVGYPAVGDLLKTLNDNDPAMRRYAAETLGNIDVEEIRSQPGINYMAKVVAHKQQGESKEGKTKVFSRCRVPGTTTPLCCVYENPNPYSDQNLDGARQTRGRKARNASQCQVPMARAKDSCTYRLLEAQLHL